MRATASCCSPAGQQQGGLAFSPPTNARLQPCSSSSRRLAPPRLQRCRVAAVEVAQQEPQAVTQIDRFGFREGFLYEFDRGPMIGSGTFGVVHVARHVRTGQKYAVKSIHKVFDGYSLEDAFVQRVFHEVDIARHMGQSLNVIHLVEAFEDDVSVDLVLELATGGSLWGRIQRGGTSEQQAARIITDVLRAVAQCHAKGVLLRDVKPENFLFISGRESSPLKMVDFGLAQFCKPGQLFSERAGTPYYIAPEVLQQQYCFPADIWSAGVTAYQLLTGRLPWSNDADWLAQVTGGPNSRVMSGYGSTAAAHLPGHGGGPSMSSQVLWRAIMCAELDFNWPPWDNISGAARDLVSSMLERDPDKRPTAAQLLHHPWLVEEGRCRTCWTKGSSSSSSSSMGVPGQQQQQTQQEQQQQVPLYLQPLEDSLVQRLQRYGTFSRLKQVSLRHMVGVMSPQPQPPCLAVYAAEFAALDVGGSGRLPADLLVELLSSDRWDLTDVEVRMLVSQFDCDGDGCVELTEWLAALIDWTQAQQHPQWGAWVQQVFADFDQDGNGVISGPELLALLAGPRGTRGWSELDGCLAAATAAAAAPGGSYGSYGSGYGGGGSGGVVADTLPAVLRHADANGDGQLSLEEFVALLQTDEMDQLDLFPNRRCTDGSSTPLVAAGQAAAEAAAAAPLP